MDETISIVNTRDNELEFDIDIHGTNKKIPLVRFVIKDRSINYSFVCKNSEDNKWTVKIPKMAQLTKNSYSFKLEVIIDGYYFEPFDGTIDVVAEPEIVASSVVVEHPKKPTVKMATKKKAVIKKKNPAKKAVPAKEEKPKEEPTNEDIVNNDSEDSFASMAEAWQSRKKPTLNEKDKKLKSILKRYN